jgi:rubrerythrin
LITHADDAGSKNKDNKSTASGGAHTSKTSAGDSTKSHKRKIEESAPLSEEEKKARKRAKRERTKEKKRRKATGDDSTKEAPAASDAKLKQVREKSKGTPKPAGTPCSNCGKVTCNSESQCVCPVCGRPYNCTRCPKCCWFGAGVCNWKDKKKESSTSPDSTAAAAGSGASSGRLKSLQQRLLGGVEQDLHLFTRPQVEKLKSMVDAYTSLSAAHPALAEDLLLKLAVESKAKSSFNSWMQKRPDGPASQRNCFSMMINGYRFHRKVGAGDTMADANVIGDELLEKLNEELRVKDPDSALRLVTSKIPFVVEVANGQTMSLTNYVEMKMNIYVEDLSDPTAFEYELVIDKPVVVWVIKGHMDDILLGAAWLQDHFDIDLENLLRSHVKARRIPRRCDPPRPPQRERIVIDDVPVSRMKMAHLNIVKELEGSNTVSDAPVSQNFNMVGRLGAPVGHSERELPHAIVPPVVTAKHRDISFASNSAVTTIINPTKRTFQAVDFDYSPSDEEMARDDS